MADDRVIQIAVSPGTQEFPDEVYLLYQSGAVFHGSLSEEGWKWNEVSLPQGKAFHPTSLPPTEKVLIFEAMACLTPSTLWPHWDRALVQDRRWSIRSTRMSLVLGMLRGLPLQWAYLTQLLPVSLAL